MKKKFALILTTLMCASLCACGGAESTSGNTGKSSKTEQEIEITMDNWEEYFEFKEVITPCNRYNAFDELVSENITVDYCFVLKDKYEIDTQKSKVAVEITGNHATWSINADMNTLNITYIESIGSKTDFDITSELKKLSYRNDELENEQIYFGVQLSPYGEPNTTRLDEETQIRTIWRYVVDEVKRIQGTIYITEK